ncbi:ribosome biogenesis GTPase YlqF [Ideonella sp.]|jgi:ribosome biogenesis GTPase A|uniref:ribosome biogenesis GTPase YlqF n=1 Tax=Ideonella sp. TaxID=1929293 RepID=UPI0037BE3DC7
MAIQWFPGHMHATRKALEERIKSIHVVIEMLDARLPGSSSNPLLAQLAQGKPALKILNKQDLADPARTEEWLAHFNAQTGTRAIGLDASMKAPARRLVDECRLLAPNRGGMAKPLRVLICGIPNVGKSTLINTLMGKKAAKTGDEPGITKNEQPLQLASDVILYDTPGMLWPRINVEESGLHLAASGAVGRNAFDEEEVALGLLASLRRHYPQAVALRYGMSGLDALPDDEVLAAVGRKRGAVMAGGRINLQKAAEIVLNDFRATELGRITLETPEELAAWAARATVADAKREARKAAIKAGKAGRAPLILPPEGDDAP